MKKTLFSLLVLFVITCAQAAETPKKALGKWKIDVEKTIEGFKKTDEYKSTPKGDRAFMLTMMKSMLAHAEMTVTKDKMTMVIPGQEDDVSKYKVLKVKGKKTFIETIDDKGKKEAVIVEIKGKGLILRCGKEPAIFLIRKKKK